MSKIVRRTLDIFELFADQRRPLSLSEVSKLLDIPVSSCHDVLQSLEQRGYLYQLGTRSGYYPTLRMHQMVMRIAEHDPVLQRADLRLRVLRDELDESVSLARIDGTSATYLLVLEPSHPLRFTVKVGEPVRALYATSAGKAVLGNLSKEKRASAIDALSFEPMTEATLSSSSREELKRQIEISLERGWYLNREESVPGGTTISALFHWHRSAFIITVAGPTSRIEVNLEDIAAKLKQVCRDLENP